MSEHLSYAAHDVDGTLWRYSLFDRTVRAAVDAGNLPRLPGTFRDVYSATYLQALPKLIQDRPTEILEPVLDQIDEIIAQELFAFVQPLLAAERRAGHAVVLLSRSPDFVVEAFGRAIGADIAIGSKLTVENGRFTGAITPLDKAKALGQLAALGYPRRPHIAVADTLTYDRPLLESARYPLAIGFGSAPYTESHAALHRELPACPSINEDFDGTTEVCIKAVTTSGYGCIIEEVSPEIAISLTGLRKHQ